MRFSGPVLGALAIAATVAITAPGNAASLSNLSLLKDSASAQSNVIDVHFWHRTCRRGVNGWHKHVKGVGRVACTSMKCWKNRWGRRICRPVG